MFLALNAMQGIEIEHIDTDGLNFSQDIFIAEKISALTSFFIGVIYNFVR